MGCNETDCSTCIPSATYRHCIDSWRVCVVPQVICACYLQLDEGSRQMVRPSVQVLQM